MDEDPVGVSDRVQGQPWSTNRQSQGTAYDEDVRQRHGTAH